MENPSSRWNKSAKSVSDLLTEIQASLYKRAVEFRDAHIHEPKDYEELKTIVEDGWAYSWWCGDPACEAKVKEDTKATTRCIPLDQPGGKGQMHRLRQRSHREGTFL